MLRDIIDVALVLWAMTNSIVTILLFRRLYPRIVAIEIIIQAILEGKLDIKRGQETPDLSDAED